MSDTRRKATDCTLDTLGRHHAKFCDVMMAAADADFAAVKLDSANMAADMCKDFLRAIAADFGDDTPQYAKAELAAAAADRDAEEACNSFAAADRRWQLALADAS